MKEQFNNLVGKILNIPEDKLADLYESDGVKLKSDAIDQLVQIDADRIKAIKDANKEELTRMHDTGYSKGKGESLTKYEESLRSEFAIENKELKGIDLVKEIVSKNAKIEMDEEKIKLHPRYIELERKLTNDYMPKAEYDKVKNEFDEFRTQIDKSKVTNTIKTDALKAFRALKPVLSTDPVKATNQENDFIEKFNKFEYEIQTDGNHIIKIDGKRLENANGYPVTFADFVKSQASNYFDFSKQDKKGNAGNVKDDDDDGIIVTLPETEKEYMSMLANEADPKKQVALMHAWEAKSK
jgi:hypothetical protein